MHASRRLIGVIVLALLTGLPVSGTVCAMWCAAAAAPASGAHCDAPRSPASGVRLEGASGHDCSRHGDVVRDVASTAAGRAEAAGSPLRAASPAPASPASLRVRASAEYAAPPGTAPPTTTPPVLRV